MRLKIQFPATLLAAALLGAPAFAATHTEPTAKHAGATHTAAVKKKAKTGKKPVAKAAAEPQKPGPLADFGQVTAPPDVVHVANWVSYTHDSKKKAFVLIDKKQAQMYVFDPEGKLRSRSPVLLGQAVGDDSAPGVGNKPLSKMKESEKTTPAGRFLARPGKNNHGSETIWIDYNAALSMHSMRSASLAERRADRMQSPDAKEHRISYGCVNVPAQFYSSVLRPTVMKTGAYVYVLPETRTPQQQFGSYDVPRPANG